MGVYVGHFVDLPADQFIAIADDFQDALDAADMVGQADESSVRPVTAPFRMFVEMTQYDDSMWLKNARPDPAMNAWEAQVVAVSRGGPTGDTMRGYGPECPDCGAKHFPQQQCRVFVETAHRSQITLFASKSKPGHGVIEIHYQGQPTSSSDEDLVEVGAMDELGAWGVLLFLYKSGRYEPDGENVYIDHGREALLEAYDDTDAPPLPLNQELAEEFEALES